MQQRMTIPFAKLDGAGNDFVVIDARRHPINLTEEQIAHLCHRRFGIGADGLMTLGIRDGYDFEMKYYNADGALGSMCGNGGRCITAFAHMMGICPSDGQAYRFVGYDGEHRATLVQWDGQTARGIVALAMNDVAAVQPLHHGCFLDTGSPHYVEMVRDVRRYDVVGEGAALRHNKQLFPQGTNVDFAEWLENGHLFVRTFERGVEDETYSCGTGVTAAAIVAAAVHRNAPCTPVDGMYHVMVDTLGGSFEVRFAVPRTVLDNGDNASAASRYHQIVLQGPVSCNFQGSVQVAQH